MIRRTTALWAIGAYAVLALVPLALALVPPRPSGRAFWLELSIALGFIGLGQLALQFALIARYERLSRPFGIDLVMQYHRQIGILAVLLVLAHPAILALQSPFYRRLLNPLEGDLGSRTGVVSVVALLLLVVVSIWRRQLRLGYELWRVSHSLLALGGVVLALVHVAAVGRYFDAPWKVVLLSLWTLALVGVVLHLRLVKPLQLARRPWEVVEVVQDQGKTWTLRLAPVGHLGLRFSPGQFAWLKLGSPWTVDEHPFSFSSSAERLGEVEFGIKELGDFSSKVGRIPKGTRAFLDGPHGSYSTDFAPAEGYLFVAGGIGISPILSILKTLADRGDQRPHQLVYACSRLYKVAFAGELCALEERLRLEKVLVLEDPPEQWTGARGYVTPQLLEGLLAKNRIERQVFVCGPDAMSSAVEQALLQLGVPEGRIHLERFHLV